MTRWIQHAVYSQCPVWSIQIQKFTVRHSVSQDIFQRKLDKIYRNIANVTGIVVSEEHEEAFQTCLKIPSDSTPSDPQLRGLWTLAETAECRHLQRYVLPYSRQVGSSQKHIFVYCFVEFATVTQHGERRWNRTNVPIDINPFITIPPYERLSGFEPSTSRSEDQALIQLS